MVWKGIVRENVVAIEDGTRLPDGAHVEIRVVDTPPTLPADARQEALGQLLAMQLPVADWDLMEEEIIRGAVE